LELQKDAWRLPLNNTRVTLQRMRDAKFFRGWVTYIDHQMIDVSAFEPWQVEPGDAFTLEIASEGTIVSFNATFATGSPVRAGFFGGGMEGAVAVYRFNLTGETKCRHAAEEPRFFPDGFFCRLTWVDVESYDSVTIHNISRSGMGLISPNRVPKGEQVIVEIPFECGTIQIPCVVRHCVKMRTAAEAYRLGLQLGETDRVNLGKYNRLYDEVVARSMAA
jgi:hypothetical protein